MEMCPKSHHFLPTKGQKYLKEHGLLCLKQNTGLCASKRKNSYLVDFKSALDFAVECAERWELSKFVELYLLWKFPLRKYGLVPNHSFLQEISSCQTATLPDKLFPKAEEGFIQFRKAFTWSFARKGTILDDVTEVKADVVVSDDVTKLEVNIVVLGTGYDGEN